MRFLEVLNEESLLEGKANINKIKVKRALPQGGKKESLGKIEIGDKNLPIPTGTESFKIIYHDDADGVISAKVIKENLLKIMQLKWKDLSETDLLNKISTESITDGDEQDIENVLRKLNREQNQMIITVDFNRFEKFGPEVMSKIKEINGFDYHTDHHSSGSPLSLSKLRQTKVKNADTEGGIDSGKKSDSSHLASRIGIGRLDPEVIIQSSKWDSATFDEKIEQELGIKKGDPKYIPVRELSNIINGFTRGSKHKEATEAFIKDGGMNLSSMLAAAKKIMIAVNIQAQVNNDMNVAKTVTKRIEKLEGEKKEKGKLTPANQRILDASKLELQELDKKIDQRTTKFKSTGYNWKFDSSGNTKEISPLDPTGSKARRDLDMGKKHPGYPKKGKSHEFSYKASIATEEVMIDGLDMLSEEKHNTIKAQAIKDLNLKNRSKMPLEARKKLINSALSKKGDRVVVSKLAGKEQPGRHTAFAFRNKYGQKPLFGIRQWANMVQVSISPDASPKSKSAINLNDVVHSTLLSAKNRFGKGISRKHWDYIWNKILQPDGYGHSTISTIVNLYALDYQDTPFDSNLNNAKNDFKKKGNKKGTGRFVGYKKGKPGNEKEDELYDKAKGLIDKIKTDRDLYASDANADNKKKVVDWIVKELVKKLESLSYGVIVDESCIENKKSLMDTMKEHILSNSGMSLNE